MLRNNVMLQWVEHRYSEPFLYLLKREFKKHQILTNKVCTDAFFYPQYYDVALFPERCLLIFECPYSCNIFISLRKPLIILIIIMIHIKNVIVTSTRITPM